MPASCWSCCASRSLELDWVADPRLGSDGCSYWMQGRSSPCSDPLRPGPGSRIRDGPGAGRRHRGASGPVRQSLDRGRPSLAVARFQHKCGIRANYWPNSHWRWWPGAPRMVEAAATSPFSTPVSPPAPLSRFCFCDQALVTRVSPSFLFHRPSVFTAVFVAHAGTLVTVFGVAHRACVFTPSLLTGFPLGLSLEAQVYLLPLTPLAVSRVVQR